jgi:hypothetical protein
VKASYEGTDEDQRDVRRNAAPSSSSQDCALTRSKVCFCPYPACARNGAVIAMVLCEYRVCAVPKLVHNL